MLLFRAGWAAVVVAVGLLVWLWGATTGGFDWLRAAGAASLALGLTIVIGTSVGSKSGPLAQEAVQPERYRLLVFGLIIIVGALIVLAPPAQH
jgi:hypothetical protein